MRKRPGYLFREFSISFDLRATLTTLSRIHVDAASGGFIAPFATPKLEWDFKIKRVVSINTSGRKFQFSFKQTRWVINVTLQISSAFLRLALVGSSGVRNISSRRISFLSSITLVPSSILSLSISAALPLRYSPSISCSSTLGLLGTGRSPSKT